MNTPYIITIGRELGSGGKLIGESLSRKLNIPCYDKELIQLASSESGLGKEFFEKADEQVTPGFLGKLFSPRSGYVSTDSRNYLTSDSLFQIQSNVIQELAAKGSCIFVGRCADYILRDFPHLLSLFITADQPDRIQRIRETSSVSAKEAERMIEQIDRKRSQYYNFFTNKTWGMANSYDLCLNSSLLGIDLIVSLIADSVLKELT